MNAFMLLLLDFERVTWMNSIIAEHWGCDQLCSEPLICAHACVCVCFPGFLWVTKWFSFLFTMMAHDEIDSESRLDGRLSHTFLPHRRIQSRSIVLAAATANLQSASLGTSFSPSLAALLSKWFKVSSDRLVVGSRGCFFCLILRLSYRIVCLRGEKEESASRYLPPTQTGVYSLHSNWDTIGAS